MPVDELNLSQKVERLEVEILNLVFQYRRSLQDAHGFRHFCEMCNEPHIGRIRQAISLAKPIQFVLPGFPAKSPNLNHVLGKLPDKGEELALEFLNSLCSRIENIYPHGAELVICSDGLVFSDLVRVEDADVIEYNAIIGQTIEKLGYSHLTLFDLHHAFGEADFQYRRAQLVEEFALSEDEIRNLIKTSPRELALFNGIERFLLEDFRVLEPERSKNSLRKFCHELTYSVIRRSHAWSKLIERDFPSAIRLSIHPQPCHFQKLGIFLIPSKNNWMTPWHGVAVETKDGFELMKKFEALQIGARVVFEQERPSFMTLV